MPWTKLFAGIEIERHAVRRLDRDEMTHSGPASRLRISPRNLAETHCLSPG
jgi:hypothetical protein